MSNIYSIYWLDQ